MGKVYQISSSGADEGAATAMTASLRHRIRLRDRVRISALRRDAGLAAQGGGAAGSPITAPR